MVRGKSVASASEDFMVVIGDRRFWYCCRWCFCPSSECRQRVLLVSTTS